MSVGVGILSVCLTHLWQWILSRSTHLWQWILGHWSWVHSVQGSLACDGVESYKAEALAPLFSLFIFTTSIISPKKG